MQHKNDVWKITVMRDISVLCVSASNNPKVDSLWFAKLLIKSIWNQFEISRLRSFVRIILEYFSQLTETDPGCVKTQDLYLIANPATILTPKNDLNNQSRSSSLLCSDAFFEHTLLEVSLKHWIKTFHAANTGITPASHWLCADAQDIRICFVGDSIVNETGDEQNIRIREISMLLPMRHKH